MSLNGHLKVTRKYLLDMDRAIRDVTLCLEAMREDHIEYPQLRLPERQISRLCYALELLYKLD